MVICWVLIVVLIGTLGPLADSGMLDRLPWTVPTREDERL